MNKNIIIGYILLPFLLYAKPSGPEVTQGQAIFIHPSNSHMHIITGEQTIINWQDFSIHSGEVTQFIQPSTQSVVLNRVTSNQTSHLIGTLESNGKVFLINPNGIIIGPQGIVNTHTFIASTLDVLDNEFLQGNELRFRGNSTHGVINLGLIKAWDGDVILIGQMIQNRGSIHAEKGIAALTAGKEILLKPCGVERVFISSSSKDIGTKEVGVHNQGTIDGLKVRLLADGNPYKFAIKHEGKIDALSIKQQGGEVYLIAENGGVEVHGEIYAPKGEVRVLGQKVGLFDSAVIDASSDSGGGTVLFGGSFQGKDQNIINSELTIINPSTEIRVNSNKLGNAGTVVVWSDGTTCFYGRIEAKGGQEGGDGGLVEISGKMSLDIKQGKADRTAVAGKAGSLLLDPSDVIIAADTSLSQDISLLNFTYIPNASSCVISRDALVANANAGPVEITTTSGFGGNGDIILNASMDMANGYGSDYPLTLTASRDLIITNVLQNMGKGDLICNVGRDLVLDSSSAPALLGTQHGKVIIETGRDLLIAGSQRHHAMIGFDFTNMKSDIDITTGRDLVIQANKQFAMIGHTNTMEASPRTFEGNIKIHSVGRNILIIGGNADHAFAQIGHAPNQRNPTLPSFCVGDIAISHVAGTIKMIGGSAQKGTYTLIGHGGRSRSSNDSFRGNISVQAVGDITILGGQDYKSEKFSGIGFGQDFSSQNAMHTFTSSLVSIQSTEGSIYLQGGVGLNPAFIGAFTGQTAGTSNCNIDLIFVSAAKNLTLQPHLDLAANSDAAIGIVGLNASAKSNIEINVGENLNLIGGAPFSGTANAIISNGDGTQTGDIKIRIEKGNVYLKGGLPQGEGQSRAFIHSTGTLDINLAQGDLILTAHDLTQIKALGATKISVKGSINLEGNSLLDSSSIMAFGPLTINAGRDINLKTNALLENQAGALNIIAGHDLNMTNQSTICNRAKDPISIVVDYQTYSSPGALKMEIGAAINGAGPIRLYTASQEYNILQGLINGAPFIKGPIYVDQAPEKWHAHLSSDFFYEEAPFTILYIDKVPLVTSQDSRVSQQIFERSQILINEFLEKLHPYDEYLGSFLFFQTAYARDKIAGHLNKQALSSTQVIGDTHYFLRMPKNFSQHQGMHSFIPPYPIASTQP